MGWHPARGARGAGWEGPERASRPGVGWRRMAGLTGLEPATSCVTGRAAEL